MSAAFTSPFWEKESGFQSWSNFQGLRHCRLASVIAFAERDTSGEVEVVKPVCHRRRERGRSLRNIGDILRGELFAFGAGESPPSSSLAR
jgi:hypothetical protein